MQNCGISTMKSTNAKPCYIHGNYQLDSDRIDCKLTEIVEKSKDSSQNCRIIQKSLKKMLAEFLPS